MTAATVGPEIVVNVNILQSAVDIQSGHVRALLNRAEDAQDVSAALTVLDLFAPLWRSVGHTSAVAVLERYALSITARLHRDASDMLVTGRLKPSERKVWTRDRDNLAALLRGLNQRLGR